jgi:hypothetical protein
VVLRSEIYVGTIDCAPKNFVWVDLRRGEASGGGEGSSQVECALDKLDAEKDASPQLSFSPDSLAAYGVTG